MSGRSRIVTVCACIASVLVIAIADYATSVRLSLGVVYLLPALAAGLLAGTWPGLGVAATSACAWVVAETRITDRVDPVILMLTNVLLRFAVLSAAVLLLASLRSALRRAHESESRSREFLAYAAHQLRTPVAGVQASAEALVMAGPNAGDERLLANLAAEAARIGRLVRSLLRVARLDQGERFELEAIDIVELCSSEVERFRSRSSIAITLRELVELERPHALADVAATREIISNLLDNAVRHAERFVEVWVSVGTDVEVVVVDDGAGVPLGAERKVFERFLSLDGHGGAGLGLAIARDLAERQGGHLVCAGSTFTLTLPVTHRPRPSLGDRVSAVAPVQPVAPIVVGPRRRHEPTRRATR
jgi:signal transduction histidine kinase